MKNKLFYTQPTTDLLELRSEGIICESITVNGITVSIGNSGYAGGEIGTGNEYDL